MLGIEPSELMGRPYADIFAPSGPTRRDRALPLAGRAIPSAVHRMRLPFRHADGHDVMVEINGTGMTADGGSSARTAPPATSASAIGSSATCGARRASWPPARSAPTSRASCTTR